MEDAAFAEAVPANPVNRVIMDRARELGLPEWGPQRVRCSRRRGTCWAAEGARSGGPYDLFANLDAPVEVDHFASTTCCFALTRVPGGGIQVYAPHGFTDLVARRTRPNPVLAPREVYEAKAARWLTEWPSLQVDPWT